MLSSKIHKFQIGTAKLVLQEPAWAVFLGKNTAYLLLLIKLLLKKS